MSWDHVMLCFRLDLFKSVNLHECIVAHEITCYQIIIHLYAGTRSFLYTKWVHACLHREAIKFQNSIQNDSRGANCKSGFSYRNCNGFFSPEQAPRTKASKLSTSSRFSRILPSTL